MLQKMRKVMAQHKLASELCADTSGSTGCGLIDLVSTWIQGTLWGGEEWLP